MLLYYIILGETISHLLTQWFVGESDGRTRAEIDAELANNPLWVQIVTHRVFALIFVSTVSLKDIFKTHLEELRGLSYFFLVIVFLLIFLLLLELIEDQKNGNT